MDAKEFVKKHGWDAVTGAVRITTAEETAAFESKDLQYIDDENPMLGFNVKVYRIPYSDVKTLVDAYELVQLGLPELKKAMFSESKDLDYVRNWVLTVSEKLLTEKGIKLKQALQLVESVDEND